MTSVVYAACGCCSICHAMYHGVDFHTKWSLQHGISCCLIFLQLPHTQSYLYTHGLTCTHTALRVQTQSYMYTSLHVHTWLHMYTTQPYMCTHSLTCICTFMVGRMETEYKLQSLITLQIIVSQDTTSGLLNQTKDFRRILLGHAHINFPSINNA